VRKTLESKARSCVRIPSWARTQAYMERRLTEGKTKREVLRCLK